MKWVFAGSSWALSAAAPYAKEWAGSWESPVKNSRMIILLSTAHKSNGKFTVMVVDFGWITILFGTDC